VDDGFLKPIMGGTIVGLFDFLFMRRRLIDNEKAAKEQNRKIDALTEEVDDLRDQRMARIEKNIEDLAGLMKEQAQHANNSRRGIHHELTEIRTHFVHKKECGDAHGKLDDQLVRVESLAVDVARAEERQHSTAETMKTISEQQVALGQDLARLQGRMQQ